jgi:hypothetical protein
MKNAEYDETQQQANQNAMVDPPISAQNNVDGEGQQGQKYRKSRQN